jgi:hypothetical protein
LKVTGSDSYWMTYTYQDTNPADFNVSFDGELWERLPDGRELLRTNVAPIGPAGRINTAQTFHPDLTGGRNACIKIRFKNQFGTSMFSNIACGGTKAATPPPPAGSVGLGNGVHVTNADMTDWNFFPTAFDDFRIAWHVCNTKTTNSGPLDIKLFQFIESSLDETTSFNLPGGVPPMSCVQQQTDLLTSFSTSHFEWQVFINNQFGGSTGMSFHL